MVNLIKNQQSRHCTGVASEKRTLHSSKARGTLNGTQGAH